jgi:hypothetical protein
MSESYETIIHIAFHPVPTPSMLSLLAYFHQRSSEQPSALIADHSFNKKTIPYQNPAIYPPLKDPHAWANARNSLH